MVTRSDSRPTLAEARLCEICGVTQQYRRSLVKKKFLRAAPRGGCTLRDALELTAVKVMSDAMGAQDTTAALLQLDAVFTDSLPVGRFDLVYDLQLKLLSLARDDGTLRGLVAHGRPVRVFELGERFAQVGDAFRRAGAAAASAASAADRPVSGAQRRRSPNDVGA